MTFEELQLFVEGWTFEAKTAQKKLPRAFWETYSAMANTRGGYIALGVKEHEDGQLEAVGIDNIQKVQKDLWNTLENKSAVSVNVLTQGDVEHIREQGKDILLVQVPRASISQRPVYIRDNEENTFLRIHEGDHRATAHQIQRMNAERLGVDDLRGVEDYTLEDLYDQSVRKYRNLLSAARPNQAFLDLDIPDFLVNIGAAKRDRQNDQELRPTYAGLWMFGAESSIRERFPHWHLSFIETVDQVTDTPRWADRVAPDGTWNANILEFYLRVEPLLLQDLKTPFQLPLDSFQRQDETDMHRAVREALVNTLVHADYHGLAGVRVVKKNTGFTFRNDGSLLVSPAQVWKGGISKTRNPGIQKFFTMLRLGEREGSGGPTIQRAWHKKALARPRIQQDFENHETKLTLSLTSELPEDIVQTLIERWGDAFRNQDALGRYILALAEDRHAVTHADIMEHYDAHARDVSLKFQELKRWGMAVSRGGGRATHYLPVTRSSEHKSSAPKRTKNGSNSTPKGPSSTPKRTKNGSSSTPKGPSSTPKRFESSSVIDKVANARRVSKETMTHAILVFCRNEYRSLADISSALNRKARPLRQRHLRELIAQGDLTLRYPQNPNHPKQAYKTAPGVFTRKDA